MKKVIAGCALGRVLTDAGLIPDNCRRIVIDIAANEAAIVYYETYADEELLKVVTDSIGARIVAAATDR